MTDVPTPCGCVLYYDPNRVPPTPIDFDRNAEYDFWRLGEENPLPMVMGRQSAYFNIAGLYYDPTSKRAPKPAPTQPSKKSLDEAGRRLKEDSLAYINASAPYLAPDEIHWRGEEASRSNRGPILITNCDITSREGDEWVSDLLKALPVKIDGYRIEPLEYVRPPLTRKDHPMTQTIEERALALVNDVRTDETMAVPTHLEYRAALCRAIEQSDAFKREVSDAITAYFGGPKYVLSCDLSRFIIAPHVDPIAEVLTATFSENGAFEPCDNMDASRFRTALAKRGLAIVPVGEP